LTFGAAAAGFASRPHSLGARIGRTSSGAHFTDAACSAPTETTAEGGEGSGRPLPITMMAESLLDLQLTRSRSGRGPARSRRLLATATRVQSRRRCICPHLSEAATALPDCS
jgi:hypothetical protein